MKIIESNSMFANWQIQLRLNSLAGALGLGAMLALAGGLRAGNIYVPNNSFELPNIGTNAPYAAPVFASWQDAPQPFWYNPTNFEMTPWADLAGQFYNVPFPGEYINNCDGVQAAFLQSLPQVGIFQNLSATFNPGKFYTLTAGLIGGGGNMP